MALPSSRSRPVFGILSAGLAVVMVAVPGAIIWALRTQNDPPAGRVENRIFPVEVVYVATGVIAAVGTAGTAAVMGAAAAVVAVARRERYPGVAVIALVLCGGMLLYLAVSLFGSPAP